MIPFSRAISHRIHQPTLKRRLIHPTQNKKRTQRSPEDNPCKQSEPQKLSKEYKTHSKQSPQNRTHQQKIRAETKKKQKQTKTKRVTHANPQTRRETQHEKKKIAQDSKRTEGTQEPREQPEYTPTHPPSLPKIGLALIEQLTGD